MGSRSDSSLDKSTCSALSKALPQGTPRLDRELSFQSLDYAGHVSCQDATDILAIICSISKGFVS